MRSTLIISLLFITACHKIDPKQQKSENLVKVYLNKNIVNQSEYEGLSFSKLIPLKASFIKTKYGDSLDKKIKLERDSMMQLDSQESRLTINLKINQNKIESLRKKNRKIGHIWATNMNKIIYSELASLKGPPTGYILHYAYKTENDFQETVYHKMTFHFNIYLSKITSVKDTIVDQQDIDW
jgi:hypothetical protein